MLPPSGRNAAIFGSSPSIAAGRHGTTRMSDELHQQLHEHAASLRTLARDLLRDVHAADDVAQATMHQALARPPQSAESIGGWLHRTLVNFVHQWRRGERRRATHEGAQPTRAAEPAAA